MKHAKTRTELATIALLAVTLLAKSACATPANQDRNLPASARLVAAKEPGSEDMQVDDHLFDVVDKLGARAKESNEINLDKSMLGFAASKGGDKGELAQKLDYIVVRDYEFARENEYSMDDLKPIFKKLDEGGWKHLVRSREEREMTDICIRQDSAGTTKEMVIISAEPKELSLIHLKGNVNLSDMKNFGSLVKGATKGEPGQGDSKPNRH